MALGLGVGLILVAGVVFLMGGPRASMRSINDARALAALPQRDVAPMLALNDGTPDFVVFQDGDAGWFELDLAAVPDTLQIGFHGPRLIDMLGGGAHVSIYCGGSGRDGKIIWIVQDGQIARDYAFCNPRRMDLGALHPLASPAEVISVDAPRDDILALIDTIEGDPSRAIISQPRIMYPYTERYILTPPLMWYVSGQTPNRYDAEQAIEAAILAHLGEAQLAFRPRPSSNPNLSFSEIEVSGMAIQHEGSAAVVPNVRGEAYEIWIDCVPESCARIATLDLDGLFDAGRDLDGLRSAMDAMVMDPTPEFSPTPVGDFPTLAELESEATSIAAPIPITYTLRYLQRPQSD